MKGRYKLIRVTPISGKSPIPNNDGQTPRTAKKLLRLINPETGHIIDTTDNSYFKQKRHDALAQFEAAYNRLFNARKISLFALVVNSEVYPRIGRFIADFKKKLRRKGLNSYGHVWVRDVGEIEFQRHCHVIVATDRCNGSLFKQLFEKKQHDNYNVEFCNSQKGLTKYIEEKELYGTAKQRSYGKSKIFCKPKAGNSSTLP